jgi:hypothetical protein
VSTVTVQDFHRYCDDHPDMAEQLLAWVRRYVDPNEVMELRLVGHRLTADVTVRDQEGRRTVDRLRGQVATEPRTFSVKTAPPVWPAGYSTTTGVVP